MIGFCLELGVSLSDPRLCRLSIWPLCSCSAEITTCRASNLFPPANYGAVAVSPRRAGKPRISLPHPLLTFWTIDTARVQHTHCFCCNLAHALARLLPLRQGVLLFPLSALSGLVTLKLVDVYKPLFRRHGFLTCSSAFPQIHTFHR